MTSDGLNTLTYDAENRVVANVQAGATSNYTLDGNSLRVKKVSGGTTTVYIFSGTKVLAEYDNGAAPASPTREYIYSGSTLVAKIEGTATNYFHPDHLSTRVVTDSSANSVRTFGHYPFGETWYETGTASKWKFTTYERDAESGNDYAMFRTSVSRLGRFSSPDPIGGSILNPQSLNRYTYVVSDPIDMTDPSGLSACVAPLLDENGNVQACYDFLLFSRGWGGGAGGGGARGIHPPLWDDPPGGGGESFADCVKKDGNYFSLQNGLRAVTGGRLGNGFVSSALLGNSVSGAIDFVQSFGKHEPGTAVSVATGEAVSRGAGPAATAAASRVPNVAFSVTAAATVSVQTPTASTSLSLAARISGVLPTGTLARAGARLLSGTLSAVSHVKDPLDATVALFSSVVCGIGR